MARDIGIIDLGSNTARLVIYRHDQGQVYEIDNIKRVLRLSNHLQNGRFDQTGMEKTLSCMRQFKEIMEARAVKELYGVATAAVRQASNGNELLDEIETKTGISMRILRGEEEARYGYLAIMNSLNVTEGITVDIGGGSTEITYFQNRELQHSVSFPFGIVNLTKMFLLNEIPSLEELDRLKRYIHEHFSTPAWIIDKQSPIIAIGGTARNLAKIHQRQRNYSLGSLHHYIMTPEQVRGILEKLRILPLKERSEIPGVSKDRVDVIIPGIAVLQSLLAATKSNQLIISNKGLRDGVIYEKVNSELVPTVEEVRQKSIEQFLTRYQVNKVHAYHVRKLAVSLFDELNRLQIIRFGDKERHLLEAAALLRDVGRGINVYESSEHTFYLLSHVLLLGFSHPERLLIAMIASYKNNKQLQARLLLHQDIIQKSNKEMIEKLGHIVLLAQMLDRSLTQQVREIRVKVTQKDILLECICSRTDLLEFFLLEDVLMKLSKVFKHTFTYEAIRETNNTTL